MKQLTSTEIRRMFLDFFSTLYTLNAGNIP